MIDPITIATGICALLKATCNIAIELKSFGDGVAIIKEKMAGLLQDVEALKMVLTSMRETFEGTVTDFLTGHMGTHWQNISRALQNGQETLAQLHDCLEEVNKTCKILDAPRKQLRLQFAADRLDLFQQHIQSYRDALQLSLQTVTLWIQVSQKQANDLILPSMSNLHEELRRVATVLNQRIEALHGMIASQAPKESQRDSQWHDESQMVAMCILRDCIHSATSVISSASSRLSSDPDVDQSVVAAAGSDLGDLFPRGSLVMLQRYIESRTTQEYRRGSSRLEIRSLTSIRPFENDEVDEPDSDDDLETEMTTFLLYKARKILLKSVRDPTERSAAERHIKICLSRLSQTTSSAQGDRLTENQRLEIEALDLLVCIYCDRSQWSDARSALLNKMAIKERVCPRDDRSVLPDLLLLARVLLAVHEYKEACSHARRTLKAYRKIGDAEGCSESLKVLICICRSDNKGDDAEAYEALLTELYLDDGLPSSRSGPSSDQTQKQNISRQWKDSKANLATASAVQQPKSAVGDVLTNKRPPMNFSYDRQHNLSDVIASAKITAKLSTEKFSTAANRRPKLVPRGANEREPIIELPPSPVEEERPVRQQEKPKLVPRGANEREPIIELPPFPGEEDEQQKPILRGANEREPISELPPLPESDDMSPSGGSRLWPKRKRATKIAARRPSLPLELRASTDRENDSGFPASQPVQSTATLLKSRTKSIDVLTRLPSTRSTDGAAKEPIKSNYSRRSLTQTDDKRHSYASTIEPFPSSASPRVRRKPALSRLEVKSMSTIWEDQWFRRNRPWLVALMNVSEDNAFPPSSSASTSDLLGGTPASTQEPQPVSSYAVSIASSDTPTPSLSKTHPALRTGPSLQTWL
ncbi:MAG: hypothetical protein M1820_002198 [Bogoriella megaspora]|nr:MAG: hypothetical protein M1820_002198 [Bogoriella megaspora]